MIRIWFFGTPYLARKVLEDLLGWDECEVVFVVTNPPKPIGRSLELQSTPVEQLAHSREIPVFTPTKIRGNAEFFDQLRAYQCDYFIVVAYGRILPLELLEIPKKMCINVHGSLLPEYRGASPIQSVLLDGKSETGVTIMEMSEWMDEGDMIKKEIIQIEDWETSESLFAKFAQLSGPTLIQALRGLEAGDIHLVPQDTSQATYCKKIEKEDGLVDWSHDSKKIYHMWQAYTPWPGIYTMYEGKRLLLEKVMHIPRGRIDDTTPGMVIKLESGEIGVICGEWVLTFSQVKLEWKKSQNIRDFVNGNQKFIGYTFVWNSI